MKRPKKDTIPWYVRQEKDARGRIIGWTDTHMFDTSPNQRESRFPLKELLSAIPLLDILRKGVFDFCVSEEGRSFLAEIKSDDSENKLWGRECGTDDWVWLCICWICGGQKWTPISFYEIESATGMGKSAVNAAIGRLERDMRLFVYREKGHEHQYWPRMSGDNFFPADPGAQYEEEWEDE